MTTWPGGAGNASKADWSPLIGREAIIWPDNDKAGVKAAEEICGLLKQVAADKICLANRPELFQKLPEKWDLADPLPPDVKNSSLSFHLTHHVKNELHRLVFNRMKLHQSSTPEKLKVAQLLFHFEKRNHQIKAQTSDGYWQQMTKQAVEFLESAPQISKQIKENPAINSSGKMVDYLTYQVQLYEAKRGEALTTSEIVTLKERIETLSPLFNQLKRERAEVKELAIHRSLEAPCMRALQGQTSSREERNYFEKSMVIEAKKISNQAVNMNRIAQVLEKKQRIQKDISREDNFGP